MSKLNWYIERIDDDSRQTIGRLFVIDENNVVQADLPTLELPWKNNQNNISCIPVGEYIVIKRNSAKFKTHFHILDVPKRSYILAHAGNYFRDIQGCILPGTSMKDIDKDGHIDVTDSSKAMFKLLRLMPNKFKLIIKNGPHIKDDNHV